MNITVMAASSDTAGQIVCSSAISVKRRIIMITNRSATTLLTAAHGILPSTRSYPIVSSMIALVGADTKLVQASKIPLTPEGMSAL